MDTKIIQMCGHLDSQQPLSPTRPYIYRRGVPKPLYRTALYSLISIHLDITGPHGWKIDFTDSRAFSPIVRLNLWFQQYRRSFVCVIGTWYSSNELRAIKACIIYSLSRSYSMVNEVICRCHALALYFKKCNWV